MKILHINNLASVSYNLCSGLNELEQSAELFYKPSKFIENKEEKWIYTPRNRLEYYFHNFINFKKYDLIHTHHSVLINLITARLKCLIYNKPCIVHFHAYFENLTIPQKIVQRISTYKPALILYSTPNIYENIKNRFKNIKKVYLPNPVVIPNIKIKETYENRVLIFTAMYKFKGLEKWIPIIKKLPHIQFDIIDRGDDRDYFRQILSDNVNPIKEVPHYEIYNLLSKYPLVFGQRNKFKVFGISELEAMSLGIPTLFDWDSNEFYDEPLPMPVDLNEKTILDTIGNFDLGNLQKEWVKKNHYYRNVAKRLLKLYEEVLR